MSLSPAANMSRGSQGISGKAETKLSQLDSRITNLVLLATQAVAFWPLWEWYAHRLIHFPENRVGLLALAAAIVTVILQIHQPARRAGLGLPAACLLLYAAMQPFTHPLVGCILAAICIGYTTGHFVSPGRRAPLIGLLLLALPVIPSLQTYVGYPLRVVIAELAAPGARLGGTLETVREGVGLRWSGGIVLVDEPCSGIRMLWTGYFLAFGMAGLLGLSIFRTAALCVITLVMVIAGNLLRALSLFTAEVRVPGGLSEQMHSAVGLFCFALAGAAIMGAAFWLMQRQNSKRGAS